MEINGEERKRFFWLRYVAVIFIILLFFMWMSEKQNDFVEENGGELNNEGTSGEDDKLDWYSSGMYKVGVDIQPGEFLIVSTETSGYFAVLKNSSGSFDSIISNDNFSYRTYVTLLDGQYFEVKRAKFIEVHKITPYKSQDEIYIEGMYKVGFDIEGGEYQIIATDSNCYIEVASDSLHILNSIISNDNFSLGERFYITIQDGQYITVNGGEICKKQINILADEDGWYLSGMYKVGVDIEPGEYLAFSTGSSCYLSVMKDSLGTFDSVISSEIFSSQLYITLLDGQYIKLSKGKFKKTDNIKPYFPDSDIYKEGMYKVGFDIPEGEYKIIANDSICYIEISSNSFHTIHSILSNYYIGLGESKYISINEGQYITVDGGEIFQIN